MTYSISLTGHGAHGDDAIDVFSDTVRALRRINDADGVSGTMVSGSISGTDPEGNSFSLNSNDVQDLEDDGTVTDEVDDEEEDDVADA